ncbi:MAG: amidohydrolase family protein [Chloroflexota bacterium]|nr:amidohydrolase family protein [Chloroflexota bacterium]
MSRGQPPLLVRGEVVLEAVGGKLVTAEGLAIGGERVIAAGRWSEIRELSRPGSRTIDARGRAVVPGLHDFHAHLVGMARARREAALDGARDMAELVARVRTAAAALPGGGWMFGRGWSEAVLDQGRLALLEAAVADRPAFLASHDGHSAWASAAALAEAGVHAGTPDPAGGRLERGAGGEPNGVLRERAIQLVGRVLRPLGGEELLAALSETAAELAAHGITGLTDAGDDDAAGGLGRYSALGDSFSALAEARHRLDTRLRITLDLPMAALATATEGGLRTGAPLPGSRTMRIGWAKAFADGALGSRTAALFDPDTCTGGTGILRLNELELDAFLAGCRAAGVAAAIHAIGDRAVAVVLDAQSRSAPRDPSVPPDRIEHAQLVRPADRARFAAMDLTASMQPIHCAADRDDAEACWADRLAHAYPWRSLLDAKARLAFGSDAPIETANPWAGIVAAVHRRLPGDSREDWQPAQAITAAEAIEAYTRAPALAIGARDEGHLHPGAVADLAVLNIDLAILLATEDDLAEVRSDLTLVAGAEVHRS